MDSLRVSVPCGFCGGVRIYKPHGSGTETTIGRDNMYVMPKDEIESLVESTGGDLRQIEAALGFKEFELSDGTYKIAFMDNISTHVSIPTGNELGANSNWLPGAFTSGGFPEATFSGSVYENAYETMSLSDFLGNP